MDPIKRWWVIVESAGPSTYRRAIKHDPCSFCFREGGTVDHIEPRWVTGSEQRNHEDNFAGACSKCNSAKGHRYWLDYFVRKQDRVNAKYPDRQYRFKPLLEAA